MKLKIIFYLPTWIARENPALLIVHLDPLFQVI
jgi:hypothetical protein